MTARNASKRIARATGFVLLWLVTLLAAAVMGKAGWSKFADAEGWQFWFGKWGYAPWFALVIGAAELAGALLILVPRLASYAAAVLLAIMIGALVTVSTNETDLSAIDPVINAVLLGLVMLGRWSSRWRPGPSAEG